MTPVISKISKTLIATACALLLPATAMAESTSPAASDTGFTTSIEVSGPITSQSIQALVSAKDSRSDTLSVFAAVMLPDGSFFFLDGKGNWQHFTGCANAPAYYRGTETADLAIPLVTAPTDLSGLKGTMVFTGYGVGDTAEKACEDLLGNSAHYRNLYTVGGILG